MPGGVTLLVTGDEEIGSPSSRGAHRGGGGGLLAPRSSSRRRERRRAEDRAEGRVALPGAGRGAGGARRARAGARRQRDRRARPPGARRRGARRPGARHVRDPDGAVLGNHVQHGARGRLVRRRRADVGQRRAGPGGRGDAVAAAGRAGRGAPGERRAEPGAAVGRGVGASCSRGPAGWPRCSGWRPCTAAAVGGASDGNFTAGVGTPTLDGLGAVGGGAHADDEHVRVAELPGRAALIAALISDLLDGAPAGSPAARDDSGSTRRSARTSVTAADRSRPLRAALAAGVTVRELSSIDELTAVIGLFDEIWAPEDGNSLMHVDLLRALTKAGNYASGRLRPRVREAPRGLRGVLRAAVARGAAQPHRGRAARRARAVRRVRAEAAPAGVGATPRASP